MQGKTYPKLFRANGKVVIITGANSGIGKETAIEMAERGATVIMACRNREKSEKARNYIIQKSGNANVHLMELDLASFKSIRKFVQEFLQTDYRLDILINNAGVMGLNRMLTEDGIEMHMGVNYMGHFLLTLLLLERLKESKPSRIVNVSSLGHKWLNFSKDLNSEKFYNRFHAYIQSKLANVMFTKELAIKLRNSGVTVNSLHPGVIYTDIPRNMNSFLSFMTK